MSLEKSTKAKKEHTTNNNVGQQQRRWQQQQPATRTTPKSNEGDYCWPMLMFLALLSLLFFSLDEIIEKRRQFDVVPDDGIEKPAQGIHPWLE